jgi:hypothetical protein
MLPSAVLRSSARIVLATAVLAVAALLPAGPAAAADCLPEPVFTPDYFGGGGGTITPIVVCDDDVGGGSNAKPVRNKRATAGQLRRLRYAPEASVSAKVHERLSARLALGENAEAIRAEIATGVLMRDFDAAVKSIGWRTNDLADEYATAYIQLWLAVNDRDRTSKRVDEAVRADIRTKLALDAKFRRMRDAEQQELGEWLGSWTVVLVRTMNIVEDGGDQALTDTLRSRIRDEVARDEVLGVDLTRIKLTRKGIERR